MRARALISGVSRPAVFGQDHPAIAPPVGKDAGVVDQVVAVFGGEDSRPRLVQRVEEFMILQREEIVAEIGRWCSPTPTCRPR